MKKALVAVRVFFAFTAWLIFKRRFAWREAERLAGVSTRYEEFPRDVRVHLVYLDLEEDAFETMWTRYETGRKRT